LVLWNLNFIDIVLQGIIVLKIPTKALGLVQNGPDHLNEN